VTDRVSQKVVLMASSEGGMDIEEVAHKPGKDPQGHRRPSKACRRAGGRPAAKIGVPAASIPQAARSCKACTRLLETDASLAEINPLNLTATAVIALDAKFNFDSNALFRHPEIVAYRDLDEEDPAEIEASKFDLAYISLDGNIGCLVNGAGLAMATMDTIKLFGGEPANFLDVGGGATTEKVTEAFKIMLKNPGLKGILVNIFGGIMRCDVIAEGVITGSKAVNLNVPLVVRMKGTNEDLGKKMLADSGLPIISADTMEEAAQKVVAAAQASKRARRMAARCAATQEQSQIHVDSDQQGHQGHHPGHHRQDRPVPHARLPRICQRQEAFVAGVNPKKAGEDFEGIPIYASVKEEG
jgi:succinyl-CoA synthetase beta subunit